MSCLVLLQSTAPAADPEGALCHWNHWHKLTAQPPRSVILRESDTDKPMTLQNASRIAIAGQRVTFERGPMGWVATGWERGLPVTRRPITVEYLQQILSRYDGSLISFH